MIRMCDYPLEAMSVWVLRLLVYSGCGRGDYRASWYVFHDEETVGKGVLHQIPER
jgi:hypothetical protein